MTTTPDRPTSSSRLMRATEVANYLGVRRPRVYALMRTSGLPRPIHLTNKSVAWIASEIDEWISTRPRAGGPKNNNAPSGPTSHTVK